MSHAGRRKWRLFYLALVGGFGVGSAHAQIVTLTTVSEVRWSDSGWGPYNDQNLAGRFTTQTFTLPRLGKVEDYFLRQYDSSSPPKYSRYTTGLHVDHVLST
jgi:hypothetical protein